MKILFQPPATSGSNTTEASGLDFITQEATSGATVNGTVNYVPKLNGLRSSMTVIAGTTTEPTVSYLYDNADKLTQVTQNSLSTVKQYNDPAGRLSSVTLPNGVRVTYGYDRDSRVTSLSYGSLGTLTYGYDADGRRTDVEGSFARTNIPGAQSFSYNPDDSLKTVGSVTVTNDANGDLTCMASSGCPQFSYDTRGRLQQEVVNGFTADLSYDALGRRDESDTSLTTVTEQYDGLNPVEVGLNGVLTTLLNGLGLDDLFMESFTGGAYSYLRDGLNSTVALTDSGGALSTQYTYDSYGNTTTTYNERFLFTGRENEGNDLYYMRARYYDAPIARFISRDPAGASINPYMYAGDDPVDMSDPTGAWVIEPPPGCDGCRALSGPDSVAIPNGFVGAYVGGGQLSSLVNPNGLNSNIIAAYHDQNGGGNSDPTALVARSVHWARTNPHTSSRNLYMH